MPIDYDDARNLLQGAFDTAEVTLLTGDDSDRPEHGLAEAIDSVFASRTQAYREALLGCFIARIQDKAINVRKPYVSQGEDSYNGRTLDERVVNPILQERRIPSSRGPFLSVFRRSVEFNLSTRDGVRDKSAYDSFLAVIDFLEDADDDSTLRKALNFVALRFVELREAATIPLTRIQRMSLEQIGNLVSMLLELPSGGRMPVYVVVAAFSAIDRFFDCGWDIQWQGINVSDSASGVGGDIEIKREDSILLAAEVTERVVDRNRVVATFNNKIGPRGIEDYLFFVNSDSQASDAISQARQYFAQGHEVNFIVIADWIVSALATIGSGGRASFIERLLDLLDLPDTPTTMRVSWNLCVERVVNA